MAEAIGLTSGLLTLLIFTYDTSKSVYEIVSSFKSQRKAVQDVETDLGTLLALLTLIRKQAERSSQIERLEPLRQPLHCCATTCKEMRDILDACTAHTADKRSSVRDWLKMQYHEKNFEDMRKRLASYKSTLSIAFATVNLQDGSATQEALGGLKELVIGTMEDLEDQLEHIKHAIGRAHISAREALQSDIDRLQSSLESITQAKKVVDAARPVVTIERNRADQGARAIFGTDTPQPQFDLNVSQNEAGIGAVLSAGVHSPETLQALLGNSQTPDLALTLQALQTQSKHAQDQCLQTVIHTLSASRSQGPIGAASGASIPTQITAQDVPAIDVSATEIVNATETADLVTQTYHRH